MLRVLLFQMLAVFVSAFAFIPAIAGAWSNFSLVAFILPDATNTTAGITDEVKFTSRYTSRQWYALGGSVIVNSIVGDILAINLVIDGMLKPDYLIPLAAAAYAPTQAIMNDMVRFTNALFMPFRVQLIGKGSFEVAEVATYAASTKAVGQPTI